ncbi:AI-2E family transporter [Occallatibacter savannae]|uniref:AI-2E family transporter n=1 Tax=Occallatibacter savannae TaxID=1002691 RepID=UPI0013A5BA8D|nr:AI-2E family transporter [Occallatibacter savannae]
MSRAAQTSYVLVAILLVLIAWLHLGTLLLTALFGYLALQVFYFRRNKTLSVTLYLCAVVVVGAGLIYFAGLAYRTLPKLAQTAIPAMVEFAEKHGIDLPFTDYESLKNSAVAQASEGISTIGRYASVVSLQTLLLLAGLVVALSVFVNPAWTAGGGDAADGRNIYWQLTREIGARFENLYLSFAKVMGAQIKISAINTVLTTAFLIISGYPSAALLVGLVFLCGLLPIVGNLISNSIIVGVGFTISPRAGLVALIFLVVIHKLEYFLNSKIIGQRIDSPVWLTLIGLVLGERLMGISGMILAPVLLYYIKVEASGFAIGSPDAKGGVLERR